MWIDLALLLCIADFSSERVIKVITILMIINVEWVRCFCPEQMYQNFPGDLNLRPTQVYNKLRNYTSFKYKFGLS